MSFEFIKIKKTLSVAWQRQPTLLADIERLAQNLDIYIKGAKVGESEEYHKNLIKDFLANTWYGKDYSVNTNGREDLVIYSTSEKDAKPTVIIEAKSPTNTAEMFSQSNLNCKALQECVYYFMQEAVNESNKELKSIIITNYDEFYIFDAQDFSRFLLGDKAFIEEFKKFEAGQLTDKKTSFFYEKCAKPKIAKWIDAESKTQITHFKPSDYQVKSDNDTGENALDGLIPLYKILSPEHLLKKSFTNDANSLDKNFYEELLYIIGLEEVKEGGKKLIRRATERKSASLLEEAMYQLEEDISREDERFEAALKLVITWVNRLLFLKLVESQQLAYQKGNEAYKFLTKEKISDFDELNVLFFKVLGKNIASRDSEVSEKYKYVPYLNSSLFELSAEEREYSLQIRGIRNRALPLYKQTVLKTSLGVRRVGEMDNLEYIFAFLDAYNFSSESSGGITKDTKVLINASVLGLIFEKINGYKDGSFFTPSFITEYMAKEAVEKAVVQKFNDAKSLDCKSLDDVKELIEDRKIDAKEASEIFNTIRVLDPAVGSGHFLVSVLNRLLFTKSYLNILFDKEGKKLSNGRWEFHLENDEISVTDTDEDKAFEYNAKSKVSQRVQETLFNEKKKIIENSLFGVDINPASVYICRLRLWIELLKNAYYNEESGSLETLPNIDINIKCGNSLVSRYGVKVGDSVLRADSEERSKETRALIAQYRQAVNAYKNESNKEAKKEADKAIKDLKARLNAGAQLDLFDEEANKKIGDENIFKHSMEWSLEFPEVLDDDGKFMGFDVVIGNPPYISAPAQVADEKMNAQRQVIINSKRFKSLYQKWDIYIPFIELGLMLAKENAICTMIVPFPLTNQLYAKVLRQMLTENYDMFELCDLSGTKVFDEATVSNCIPFIKKVPHGFDFANAKSWISKIDENLNISRMFEQSKNDLVQDEKNYVWNVTQEKRETNRHANMHVLGDYCYISIGMVLNADEKTAKGEFTKDDLICETQDEIHCKEYIEAKNIDKYSINKIRYLEYGTERVPAKIRRPTFPELYNRPKLLTNKIGEMKVVVDYNNIMCDQTNRILILWKDIKGVENKSIASSIKKYSTMTREDMEELSETVDLRYLLGVMNSKYASVLLDTIRGAGNIDVNPEYIRNIPIPDASTDEQQKIIDLVDKILEAKQAASTSSEGADTAEMEKEIDAAVYALYGLSEEEIQAVEKA